MRNKNKRKPKTNNKLPNGKKKVQNKKVRIKPLPHQRKILKELKGKNAALIHSASGSGKTHTAAFLIKNEKPKSFLYLAHRNELLIQSKEYFKEINDPKYLNDKNIGLINSKKKEFDKPFLFATVQTVSRPKNLEKLNHGRKFDYLIVDEYHHVAAKTYQKILNTLKFKRIIGLTATPFRTDNKDIMKHVKKNIVGNIDIFEGIEKGILVPFDYVAEFDNFITWDDVKRYNGYKYRKMDLDRKLLVNERDKLVIDTYKKNIQPLNVSTLGFCATIKHVQRMVKKFREEGIDADGITEKDPLEARKIIIDRFRRGHTDILFSIDILNEGIDFPECGAIMMLRPTQSQIIFEQQLGRGLRKDRAGKKERVLVLDFLSNYERVEQLKIYLKNIAKQKPTDFEEIMKGEGGRYTKPIHRLSYPRYAFNPKVVEMMELKEKLQRRVYTDQELIDNYYEVKRKLAENRRR